LLLSLIILASSCLAQQSFLQEVKIDYTQPLNDYINAEDNHFKWHDTGVTFKTLKGGKAHVINVTSIQWFDDELYKVSGGSSVWTHEVVVIVPRNLEFKNVSTLYLASAHAGCNN